MFWAVLTGHGHVLLPNLQFKGLEAYNKNSSMLCWELMQKRKRKPSKVQSNLDKVVRQYVQGKSFRPQELDELLQTLGLPYLHQKTLLDILDSLIDEGLIDKVNGKYVLSRRKADIVQGVLRVHPKGFGFLQPDSSSSFIQDIFIPKHLTMHAVDGDRVEVVVNPDVFSEKGPEGRVITILKRSRTHIAGIINNITRNGDIQAYVPLLGSRKRVHVEGQGEVGDRVIMEVLNWGSNNEDTEARITHKIGHISDPSCDIEAAIEEFELRNHFPAAAIEEAQQFGTKIPQSEISNREDLRELECVTIDPKTAKDFDDALSLSKDKKGHYHLGVHIADVTYYVQQGGQLDIEAKKRCNSTYFPNFCLPMLPKELSENLCSLKPNVNRLAATVFMEFNQEGALIDYRITRSVIKSKKRFTYEDAKEVLDGKQKSIHSPLLKRMKELCLLLKRQRYLRGSIEFSLPELLVLVNEGGMPYATEYIDYDITHQMVEEFMLKANETVALHLSKQGKALAYRVHDEPSEDNLREFATLARTFGFSLPDEPSPKDLQKMFDEALNDPDGSYLATSFIRRMRMASYSPQNIGHYGLALTHYCHFTSPIRRYTDLVIHRILFEKEIEPMELDAITLRCSEQERISSRAESSVKLLKKLRFLEAHNREEPHFAYHAVVTQIKPFGFYFEVLDLMLEGFVHLSELDDDYYIYDESYSRLRGRSTKNIYQPGTPIDVMLKHIDLIFLETGWHIVPS